MHDLAYAYLERAGYELISAYAGESGLRLAMRERPDVVLLDYMMPGIDGEEVFHRLQNDDSFLDIRDTPVIFLTARGSDDELKQRLIQRGVVAYLQKPFGLRELSNILENIFIVNDIQRKNRELEREIKTTHEYLDYVIQNAPVGIFTTNANGDIIEANPLLQRILSIESLQELKRLNAFRSEILQKSFIATGVRHVLREGSIWSQDMIAWRLPNGEQGCFKAKFVPMNPSQRQGDEGVIGIVEDITARERTSYELRVLAQLTLAMQQAINLQELLQLLLRSITAGQVLGFSSAMIFLSQPHRRTLKGVMGVRADSRDHEIVEVFSQSHPELLLENLVRQASSGNDGNRDPLTPMVRSLEIPLDSDCPLMQRIVKRKPYRLEVASNVTLREDERQLVEKLGLRDFIAVPLVANDALIGMIVADTVHNGEQLEVDRTHLLTLIGGQAANAIERARTYEQLQREKQKLEEAYAKLRITHERLVQSERLAAIGEMAAHVAHEIRNPLVTIGGFARQLSKKSQKIAGRNEAAEIIAEEVIRLEKILANVLNFTRLPKPQLGLNNINKTITATCRQLHASFKEKHIQLRVHLQPDIPDFQFDEQQMKQVLLNLLQNSEQSISNGGGVIGIETRCDGDTVFIKVSDNGSGIPREMLEVIFNPFYTTKEHGTGLGLAITQQIIHAHGGRIDVVSQVNRGTIFKIQLPLQTLPYELQDQEQRLQDVIH